MKILKQVVSVIFVILIWVAFIGYGFINGFLLKPITFERTPKAFIEATKNKVNEEFVGNMAMTLIENGKIAENYFYSIGQPVNEYTIFQVASVSKWITAFGIMKLVEDGKLDLDQPIDNYLTRWHLPKSDFDNNGVTVRLLLSHSAGLVDDLGYNGFKPNEKVQTIEESLTKASDGYYPDAAARVGYEPGSKYMYSGAGYTILQLIIEEVSGQTFQDYMIQNVFEPLEMQYSTFILSEKSDLQLAQLFNEEGDIVEPLTFTALAAASLYTCTADLSKFMIANISDNPVLKNETITQMSESTTFINNIGVYGLGPHLYSQNDENSLIIGHDGSGDALNTSARIDLQSRNGIIILERGNQNLASNLADEWMFWKAGIADFVVMQRNLPFLFKLFLIGALLITALSILIVRNLVSK